MRIHLYKLVLGCTFFLPLTSCAQLPEGCPFSAETDNAVSAGCFYVQDNELLVVQNWAGKISLPGGLSKRGETARCTAYRETWEETGLLLQLGERIEEFHDKFFLYRCERSRGTGSINPSRDLEVRRAFFISPDEFKDYRWRFPGDTELTRRLLLESIVADGE